MAESWESEGLAMQDSFLHELASRGLIDSGELAFLDRVFFQEGPVDDEERKVLNIILSNVGEHDVSPEVWEEIRRFRAAHGI